MIPEDYVEQIPLTMNRKRMSAETILRYREYSSPITFSYGQICTDLVPAVGEGRRPMTAPRLLTPRESHSDSRKGKNCTVKVLK